MRISKKEVSVASHKAALYKITKFKEKLTKLQTLHLYDNQISDISFLEKLTNLDILNLYNNKISDIDKKRLKEKLPNCYISFD